MFESFDFGTESFAVTLSTMLHLVFSYTLAVIWILIFISMESLLTILYSIWGIQTKVSKKLVSVFNELYKSSSIKKLLNELDIV